MTTEKLDIEAERFRFIKAFKEQKSLPDNIFRLNHRGDFELEYMDDHFVGWLAAKQDAKQLKVGDIVETESGLFQVIKYPDLIDDSGIIKSDINR